MSAVAIHFQLLTQSQTVLQAIEFPAVQDLSGGPDISLDPNSIVVIKFPLERLYKRTDEPLALPCILITPQRVQAPPTLGVNSFDDYLRPVLVTMVMRDNQEPTLQLNLDVMAMWQQLVMHAFHNQRLAGVSQALICAVEPAEVIIPVAWSNNVLASAVSLKFTCREPRGLNV